MTGGRERPLPGVPTPHRGGRPGRLAFNVRLLRTVGQVAAIELLIGLAAYLGDNYQANVSERNARTGWGFLNEPTGFNVRPPVQSRPAGQGAAVGRHRQHRRVRGGRHRDRHDHRRGRRRRAPVQQLGRPQASTLYVEVIRNVPVLLVILFLAAGLQTLPPIDDARSFGDVLVISNRAIAVMSPEAGDNFGLYLEVLAARRRGWWRSRRGAPGCPPPPALPIAATCGPAGWSRRRGRGRLLPAGAADHLVHPEVEGAAWWAAPSSTSPTSPSRWRWPSTTAATSPRSCRAASRPCPTVRPRRRPPSA